MRTTLLYLFVAYSFRKQRFRFPHETLEMNTTNPMPIMLEVLKLRHEENKRDLFNRTKPTINKETIKGYSLYTSIKGEV